MCFYFEHAVSTGNSQVCTHHTYVDACVTRVHSSVLATLHECDVNVCFLYKKPPGPESRVLHVKSVFLRVNVERACGDKDWDVYT